MAEKPGEVKLSTSDADFALGQLKYLLDIYNQTEDSFWDEGFRLESTPDERTALARLIQTIQDLIYPGG